MKTLTKQPIFYTLTIFALVELLLFLWLCSPNQEAFRGFVSSPDTGSYIRVAINLVEKGTLIASPRTLGYPLFLSIGYLLGGVDYGAHVVIAAQLVLNIVFTWGLWTLLERIAPSSSIGIRIAATLLFFWAGLGMALNLLSDFLASFFFGCFLYGLFFWRSRASLLLSGSSLALATLIRPTFTLIPLLFPFAAYLVGRVTSKVPFSHVLGFVFASLAATGISVAYQYSFQGYAGPSPVLAKNIGRTLHSISNDKGMGKEGYEAFNQRIADRAGKPYSAVSPSEEEKYAVALFVEEFKSRPKAILVKLSATFVKYLLAPVESLVVKLIQFYTPEPAPVSHARLVLTLLCLPLWLLSLAPPIGQSSKLWAYYLLVMLLLVYVSGMTAINPFQGERIRFPLLAFMLPVMASNVSRLYAFLGREAKASAKGNFSPNT